MGENANIPYSSVVNQSSRKMIASEPRASFQAFELPWPGRVKVLSFVSLIYVPVLNYTVEDEEDENS